MPAALAPTDQTPLSSRPKTTCAGLVIALFFFSIFTLVGGGLFYGFTVRPVLSVVRAKSWATVPCQITGSNLTRHADDDGDTYSADITYVYSVGGQRYNGDRYGFANPNTSYSKAQSRAGAFPVGATRQCFVKPAAPTEAVLDRDFHFGMLTGCFGLIFLAVGLGVPFGLWRQSRRQTRLTSGNRTEFWQPQPSPTATALPGGSVQLQPSSTSPLARMLGAWFFCLFWNGITGTGAWAMLHGGSSRTFVILPLLFLIPFSLIGLGLLWLALTQTLALFNPRPTLRLTCERLYPGQSVEMAWQLRGGWSRPQSVRLVLEGVEEVKFTRGTDTITQKQIFFSAPLYESPPGAVPASGSCRAEIPPGTMHSFEAPHNAIRWVISLKAPQRGLPDIGEEWKLLVEPSPAL